MNKDIYKLVWNKQISALVPVSETAKSKSKQSRNNANKKSIAQSKTISLFVSFLLGAVLTPAFSEICENDQNIYSRCNLVTNFLIDSNINLIEKDFLGIANLLEVNKKPIDLGEEAGNDTILKGERKYILDGFDVVVHGGGKFSNLIVANNANIFINASDATKFYSNKDIDIGLNIGSGASFTIFSKDSILLGKDITGANSKGLGYLQIGSSEGENNGAKLIIAGGLNDGKESDNNPDSYNATNGVGIRAYYDSFYNDPIILNLETGSLVKSTGSGLEVYAMSSNDHGIYIRNAGKIIAGVGGKARSTGDVYASFEGVGITILNKSGRNTVIDLEGGEIDALFGINIVDGGQLHLNGGTKGATIISNNPFINGPGLVFGSNKYNIYLDGKITLKAKTNDAIMGLRYNIPSNPNPISSPEGYVDTNGANINIVGFASLENRTRFLGDGEITFKTEEGLASETTISESEIFESFTGTANVGEGYKVRIQSIGGNTWNLGSNAILSFMPELTSVKIDRGIYGDETTTLEFETDKAKQKITFSKEVAEEFKGFVNLSKLSELSLSSDTTVFKAKLSGIGTLKINSAAVALERVDSFGGAIHINDGSKAVIKSSAKDVTWYTNKSGILNFVDVSNGSLGADLNGKGTVQLTNSSLTLGSETLTNFAAGTFSIDARSSLILDGFTTFTNTLKGSGSLTNSSKTILRLEEAKQLTDFEGTITASDNSTIKVSAILNDNIKWDTKDTGTLIFNNLTGNFGKSVSGAGTIALDGTSSMTVTHDVFRDFTGNFNLISVGSNLTLEGINTPSNTISGNGTLFVSNSTLNKENQLKDFKGTVNIIGKSIVQVADIGGDNTQWELNEGSLVFNDVKEGNLGVSISGTESSILQLKNSNFGLTSSTNVKDFKGALDLLNSSNLAVDGNAMGDYTGNINLDKTSKLTLNGSSIFTNRLKGDGTLVAKNNGTPLVLAGSEQLSSFVGTIKASDHSVINISTPYSSEIIWDTSHLGTLVFNNHTGDFGKLVIGSGTIGLDGNTSSMIATQLVFSEFTGSFNLINAKSKLTLKGIDKLNNNVIGSGALVVENLESQGDRLKEFTGTVEIQENSTVKVADTASGTAINWNLNNSSLSFKNIEKGNFGASISGTGKLQLDNSSFELTSNTNVKEFTGTIDLANDSIVTSNEEALKDFNGNINLDNTSALTLEGFTTVKNQITGTGALTVDSKGSAFSVGDNLTEFKGILALNNNTYTLDDKVTKLKLEMGQGNITTIGNTESNKLDGLAFNGGTMIFDSKTSKQVTVVGGDIAVDLTNKGTLKLTNADAISVPGVEPGGVYTADSLMSIDEGETVQTVVIGKLAGASTASNISLVDQNGNGFVPDKEVVIKQGNEEVATGKFGLSLATQNSKNTSEMGLFVNYSLTEVDVHEGKNIALVSSEASSMLSLKNDLSAKITGQGGLIVSLSDKDHVVSLSNTDNDYLGKTLVNKGTLYIGKNTKTGLGDTIIEAEGILKSAGIVSGNLINRGVVDIAQLSYVENKAQAFNANPSLTLRVEKDLINEGTIYVDRNNLGSKNTLSIDGDLSNAGSIYLSNQDSHFVGNTLSVNGDYIALNHSSLYLNATATGNQDKIKIAGNVSRQDEGKTTLYVTDTTEKTDNAGEVYNKIKLIEVGGTSEEGAFVLGNDVFLGSYQYLLSAENNKDWVLTAYLPPVDPVNPDPVDPDPGYPIDPIKPIDPVKPVKPKPEPIIRVDLGSYTANMESMVKAQLSNLGNQGAGGAGAGGLSRNNRFDNAVWTTSSYDQMKGNQTGSDQIDFDYKYYSMNVGADHQLSLSNGQGGRIGLMVGTSKSDTSSENKITHSQSIGTVKGTMVGIYGSWYLEKENTLSPFVDVTLTYDQYKNTVQTKGNSSVRYNSNITNFSLQGGYPILIAPNLVVEPQAQLSYLNYSADQFIDHTGTKIKLDLKGNMIGRVGAYLYPEQGEIKPYAGLNVWFDNTRTEVSFNNQTFKSKGNDHFSYEGKVGVTGNVDTNLNLSGELNYRKNADKSDKWGANISLKYQF